MKHLKISSRSEVTQKTSGDFSDKLTNFLDDAWKPWVGIAGIFLTGLFLIFLIATTVATN